MSNVEIDNLKYFLLDLEATVIVYVSPPLNWNLVIPSTITDSGTTYTVTSINDGAFYDCTSLKSITIPNSVTSIGIYAFYGCTGLTSINFNTPSSVTSIGSAAFQSCYSLTSITIPSSITSIGSFTFQSCSSLTSITIPSSVTSIGPSVFYDCTSLTNIVINSNITNLVDVFNGVNNSNMSWTFDYSGAIPDNSCYQLSNLANVNIGNQITSIGNFAFSNCNSLTSIIIPSSVESIGNNTFASCSNLLNITFLPDINSNYKIKSIGTSVFDYCSKLTSILIPSSIEIIGNNAFANCTDLSNVLFLPDSSNNYNTTIIGSGAFFGCSKLTSITIPNSVITISGSAFSQCIKLTSIIIPNSVTTIEGGSFQDCTNLLSVTFLPDISNNYAIQNIGYNAFAGCTGLTSITIPNSVTNISNNAFYGCNGLKNIVLQTNISNFRGVFFNANNSNMTCTFDYSGNISDDILNCFNGLSNIIIGSQITSIGNGAFSNCADLSNVLFLPDSSNNYAIISIGNTAFSGCSGLISITIPSSVTSIGNFVFLSCFGLTNITMPSLVTSIGDYVFYNCTNLTSITIPSLVTSIGDYVFYNCTKLKSITIPSLVTSIGESAFQSCTGLTSITIPSSVTSIGESAFQSCTGLTSITIPSSVTIIGNNVFYGCTSLTNIVINSYLTNLVGVFNGVDNPNMSWTFNYSGVIPDYVCNEKTGVTSIIIGNQITSIGYRAFYNCTALTTVIFDSSSCLTTINESAYQSCTSLTSITIPNSVTIIGNDVFNTCTSLANVILPNNITTLNNRIFGNCTNLLSITIPNSVTIIKSNLFDGCIKLKKVDLSNNITYIGHAMFANCTDLSSILIPNSVTVIGSYGFYCSGLTNITLPDSVTSIGIHAFQNCNKLTAINIPDSVTGIGDNAFSGCTSLTNLILPNNINIIGNGTFSNCSSLINISLSLELTELGQAAFAGCTSLTSIILPSKLTTITGFAFAGCNKLANITIPASVIVIGNGAFSVCTLLNNVTFLGLIPTIAINNFGNTNDNVKYRYTINQNNNANVQNMLTMFSTSENLYLYPINGSFNISNKTYLTDTTIDLYSLITDSNFTGNYIFSSSNPSAFNISGNIGTIYGPANNIVVTATPVSNDYDGSLTATFSINKATTTITNFIVPSILTIADSPFDIVDPNSNSDGSFIYSSSNSSVATVVGNTVTITGLGSTTITVTQEATTLYNKGTNTTTLFIYGNPQVVNSINTILSTVIPINNQITIDSNTLTPQILSTINPVNGTPEEKILNRDTVILNMFKTNEQVEKIIVPVNMIYLPPSINTTNSNNIEIVNTTTSTVQNPKIIETSQILSSNIVFCLLENPGNSINFNGTGSNSEYSILITKNINNTFNVVKKYLNVVTETTTANKGDVYIYAGYKYVIGSVAAQVYIPPIVPICFPAGTPVITDQGAIPIEKINPVKNTIRGKKIVAITKTVTIEDKIVCIEKDALGANIPSQKTFISRNHKLFYNKQMIKAKHLVGQVDGVYNKKYNGEILYNVLLETYEKMLVNNLIVETLDPTNIVAQIYNGSLSDEEINNLILNINYCVNKYKKQYGKLK